MQLLAGSKIIEVDRNSKTDTALYKGAEKLFGVVSSSFAAIIAHRFALFDTETAVS
jgi:preprotein translocase subunit SecY